MISQPISSGVSQVGQSTDSYGRTDGLTDEVLTSGFKGEVLNARRGGTQNLPATTQEPLFSGYESSPSSEPSETLSADRRRTLRQRQQVATGIHPLTGLKTHPELGTCGDCRFRQILGHHMRSFPKCTAHEHRITHSAASDCRAWWPACHEHELGDPKVSSDAMRCRP
jgi:hypothetical protein